jgi:cephalosporin hydroxylase
MELLDLVKTSNPNTDKVALGYFDVFYDKLFSPRKETTRKVLEIGVWQGGSILLWRDFFIDAHVYGVDIQSCEALDGQDRIVQHVADAYSTNYVDQYKKESFDIIIDDGPHTFESMVFFIQYYLPLVRSGGVLVLEDIINPKWTPMLINMIDPSFKVSVFDMRNKQRDEYLNDKWKNGLDVLVVEKNLFSWS